MAERSTGPEPGLPKKKGSRLLGLLGAFLGAIAGALLCDWLVSFLPDDLGRLAFFGGAIWVGWLACWGYRLLRGYRSMRFAQWAVRSAIALAQPLSLFWILVQRKIQPMVAAGITIDPEEMREFCRQSLAFLTKWDSLKAMACLILISLFFARLSWGGLLKYTDPAWYHDPRRLAQIGGGGATFNMLPCWPLPPAESIPAQFSVDKGKLTVDGSLITFKPWGKPSRSFPADRVAGVVLGVSSGFNILYDKEHRELARFAWSRKNALLFGQYLTARNVPFVDLNGVPVAVQAEGRSGPV